MPFFFPWFRRPARRPAPHVNRPCGRPLLELLEDRTLLNYSLSSVLGAYNTGVSALGTASTVSSLADSVFGVNLPLAGQSLAQGLGLVNDLQAAFQGLSSSVADSDWNTGANVASQLQAAGLSIVVPSPSAPWTGSPDANNNLLEVAYVKNLTPTDPIQIEGSTGFSYLDAGGGGLYGGLTGTGSVAVNLTFGVDVNPTTQQLNLFIAPGNAVTASLSGSTAANALSGTIAIGDNGDLPTVNVQATAGVNFTGTLNLRAGAAETDGKLRVADLTSNLTQSVANGVVAGGVNGAVTINASLSAQLMGLSNVTWTANLGESVVNNVLQSPSVNLQTPSASALLGSLGASLFSLGDGIPVLGPLASDLNSPLPVIGKSIGQLTGLDADLPQLPALPSGFGSFNPTGSYPLAGGTLTLNLTPTSLSQFFNGQDVTLISWQDHGDYSFSSSITVPIFSVGVPEVASLDIDATFGVHASLEYNIGFGLDGHGFYALAGTPTDPTLGISFGVTAGIQGDLEVFGFPLASAGGDIGFSVTPYVSLTPAPASVDPHTDPTKVYMSDLALFGSNPVTDLADDLTVGIQGDITGDLYAKIDLLFFSVSWGWGISIPVFNYSRAPSWPSPVGGVNGQPNVQWPNVNQHGSVLTFTGTSAPDDVTLVQGTNGQGQPTVTVDWAGQGSETFAGVSNVIFNGGSGNDTLTAASGFDTPVRAVAGSGTADFDLHNNAATDTLVGGTGASTLIGGSGNDLLIAGSGPSTITATGAGADSIYGGSGSANVTLNAGNDTFSGASGNYGITGGSGSHYTIDGGSGSDTIIAGTGSHDTIYGGSGGHNLITGSTGGYNLIYGGGAGDTLVGGGGYDTLYGSAGASPGVVTANVITGGPLGGNLIFGGGGGDILVGGGGNNTLYAGSGNETLAGGDGQDLVVNPQGNGLLDAAGDASSSGSNLLIGGPGNDTLFGDTTGHNTLQAGPGNDTLYAGSGGDALVAGLGTDALYGSIGNDTFQLPFTPTGQTQPDDTLVGGGGDDTLVLKAETGSGTAGLDVTTANAMLATDTSVTVVTGEGATIAADLPANGSGLVIDIGSEQMLVTSVTGDTLTVQRGYDGTTAAPHGNDALILLPNNVPSLPAPNDYALYLNQTSTADQYDATLSTLRFATTAAGSSTVTGIDSTVGLAVGMTVTGPGIPTGTTIVAIASGTSLTLSASATLSQANLPLTFGSPVGSLAITLPADIPNVQLDAGSGNNLIQVDPSVNRDMTLYGGPGYNVLMAGSGNDDLIAGPGTAVLYGGAGQDTFYGGDLPTQDLAPSSSGFTVAPTVTSNTNPVAGNDTLIAGSGSDELFAGSGNDLLIGGSVARLSNPATGAPSVAQLQGGQFQLVEGAGRDVLVGGSGNDVLIAGPGGPGAVLEAGTGNNTLIAQNYGVNTLSGGSTGNSLLLGGNLENFEVSNSVAGGGNTLVGGLGIDNLQAGKGNDVLYASYNAAAWSQGEAAAAAVGVHVVPPQLFQGDATAAQLQTLLEDQQSGPLSPAQQNQLLALLSTEFTSLTAEEATLNAQVSAYLAIPNISQNLTLKDELIAVAQQDESVQTETAALLNQILNALGAGSPQEDQLVGGSGSDTFYGNVQGATWMGGGSGNQTFYNYESADTIQGNLTGTNTLVVRDSDFTAYNAGATSASPNVITLSQDNGNSNAVDVTVNGQTELVGDAGQVSGIQELELVTGSASDAVTVNLGSLPPGLNGLIVTCGSGNDVVDASAFTGNATIAAGSGSDLIKIGPVFGQAHQFTGNPSSTLEVVDAASLPVTLSRAVGLQIGSDNVPLTQAATFGGLVVVGGSGPNVTNTFTTDGSIPNVELEGGSGSNVTNDFSASGGTALLVGGSGANVFTVTGPGNYTIDGGTGSNALTIQCDNNGDAVHLSQTGSTISVTGVMTATAVNMTSVSVLGGSGNDLLDASGMQLPVTLAGGGGTDTLLGGAGSDTFHVSGNGSTYNGGGGATNILVIPAYSGQTVTAYSNGYFDNSGQGTFHPYTMTNVEEVQLDNGGNSNSELARGEDVFANGNVTNTQVFLPGNSPGSTSASQASGGPTGNYLSITDRNASYNYGNFDEVEHLFTNYVYNIPSTGIQGLQISFLATLFTTLQDDELFTVYPILEQGGVVYDCYSTLDYYNPASPPGLGSWLPYQGLSSNPVIYPRPTTYLTANSFYRVTGGSGTPDFNANGGSIEFGLMELVYTAGAGDYPVTLRCGLSTFSVVALTGQTPQVLPLGQPLTANSANVSGLPASTSLAINFSDTNSDAGSSNITIPVNWGDGTSSLAAVASYNGNGNFTATAGHIYAAYGSYTITAAVIDAAGGAASAGATFTGGLAAPDGSGNLDYDTSASTFTTIDTGVRSAVVGNQNGTIFSNHTDNSLWAISGTGTRQQVPGSYQAIALGPDGTLYALLPGGSLDQIPSGSLTPATVDSSVQAIVSDTTGDLYKLYTNGTLDVMAVGSTTWTQVLTNVKSVSTNGSGVSVLTNAGVDWQFVGASGTLVAGPHLALRIAGPVVAGQSAIATLSVLDVNNNPVLGYTGTVSFSDSDAAAVAAGGGPPVPHTFSAADNGVFSFPVTFVTSGPQSLTAADAGGLTATAAATVSAATPAQFCVDPPAVEDSSPVAVSALTWSNGIATVTTAVALPFPPATGQAFTLTGMAPAAYNGTFTVIPVYDGHGIELSNQFSFLLSSNPGAATALGTVTFDATVTVTAYDSQGNVATGFTGMVTLTPVNSGAAATQRYTFSAGDQGVHSFVFPVSLTGSQLFVATGGGQSGTGVVLVNPGPVSLAQSSVSVFPATVEASGKVSAVLTARDADGNQESQGGLSVQFALASGSVGGGIFGPVADNGDGTWTAVFSAGTLTGQDLVTATIGGSYVTTSPASLTVVPDLTVTTPSLPSWTVNRPYSQTVAASGGAAPFTFAVTAGGLPVGLSLDTGTGAVTGTPTAAAGTTSTFTVTVTDALGDVASQTYSVTINAAPTITTTTLPNWTINQPFSQTVTATGGTDALTFIVSAGNLPPGLNLNASTGALTGTPTTTAGSPFTFTVTATDAAGATASQAYTVTINPALSLTPGTLPAGTATLAYNQTLTVTGGTTPCTALTVTGFNAGGTGLTASAFTANAATGTVTLNGTPTASGSASFTVNVTDASGATLSQSETLTVNGIPTTTILTDNGPDPSLSGVGVSFTVTATPSSGPALSGETVTIEDASNGNAVVGSTTLSNGVASLTIGSLAVGTHNLFAVYGGDATHAVSQSSAFAQTVLSTFQVDSAVATPNGVVLTFDAPVNEATLRLYTTPGTTNPADVTVVGASTGPVKGSLVLDPTNPYLATFVKTIGLLATDTYTVTVTTAVQAVGGATLAANCTKSLTVTAPTAPVVTVPYFARGAGQAVNIPANSTTAGIPITLSGLSGALTSASFTLTYDPTLLSITAWTPAPGLSLTVATTSVDAHHMQRTFTFNGNWSPGSSGTLVTLTASVPTSAPYLNKALLNLGNVTVNGASAIGQAAVDEAAYLGDVAGTKALTGADATYINLVIASTASNAGFSAYKDLDPVIIGGIASGEANVSSTDATRIEQKLVGTSVPTIPTIPTGITAPTGADPHLFLGSASVVAGQVVTVPEELVDTAQVAEPIFGVDSVLFFDPSRFTVVGVTDGALLAGYGVTVNVDDALGILQVTQATASPLTLEPGVGGIALDIELRANPGDAGGSSVVKLASAYNRGGVTEATAVTGPGGNDTLTPAPQGSAPAQSQDPAAFVPGVDAVIQVTGATTAPQGQVASPAPVLTGTTSLDILLAGPLFRSTSGASVPVADHFLQATVPAPVEAVAPPSTSAAALPWRAADSSTGATCLLESVWDLDAVQDLGNHEVTAGALLDHLSCFAIGAGRR